MTTLDRITRNAAPRVPHGWVAIAVVTLAVLATSCSSDDSGSQPDAQAERSTTSSTTVATTSSSTTVSTSSGGSVEDEILARYLGFWDARLVANTGTPNPDDPALREYATGAQLETVVDETRQRRDDGLALREAEPSRAEHSVTVVSASDDRAELQDCFVNDGVVYQAATGEVVDDTVVTRSVSAVMVLEDGAWKLEMATVIQEWEGIAGCALAG